MGLPTMDEPDDALAEQFVARMVGVWRRHELDQDQLAGAMLAHAVNALLTTMDTPRDVAGLLVTLAAEIHTEVAGHA